MGSRVTSLRLRDEEAVALEQLASQKQLTTNGLLRLLVRVATGLPVPTRFDGIL